MENKRKRNIAAHKKQNGEIVFSTAKFPPYPVDSYTRSAMQVHGGNFEYPFPKNNIPSERGGIIPPQAEMGFEIPSVRRIASTDLQIFRKL